MQFITQGKNNWKFLLIVIILAVIVGGMALLFMIIFRYPPEPLPNKTNILVEGKNEKLYGITLPIEKGEAINMVKQFCEPKYPSYQYEYEGIEKVNNEWQVKIPNINCICGATVNEQTGEIKCQADLLSTNETADWKIYSDPKTVFSFKYPTDWEIKTDYQYKSASCQYNPSCEGVHYIFLNKISDSRPANLSEIEKFGIGINMPQCTGVRWSDLPGNNWICVFDENPETLDIYEQIKNSFQLIEEIKTGKVEINYEEIKTIQQSVDEGHQPWRLNPVMVLRSEMFQYGFDPDTDYNSLYPVLDIATQEKFGTEITELNLEITHNGKTYVITLIQPITGPDKVWAISDIELK